MYVELIGYIAATLTTIAFIPQALKIISEKNTQSISLAMYSMMFVGVGFWLAYGILIERMPMIICNIIVLGITGIILLTKIRHG